VAVCFTGVDPRIIRSVRQTETGGHLLPCRGMTQKQETKISLRVATGNDAGACGQISFAAFSTISRAHGFPSDVPSAEVATGLLSEMFSTPGFYCIVAESDGRIVGSNCLDERSVICGIGPITVDPETQNAGVGRKLMQAVMDRANQKGAAGMRLVQAAFHNRSLSLYAALGFDIREPLSCMQGRTQQRSVAGYSVRPAQNGDLEVCKALSRRVHGFDRGMELSQAIQRGSARVVEREGRITGYATELAFFGHATAESNADLQALLGSVDSFGGPGILVPSRNNALLRWCLSNGLRVVQPMTLMSTGLYNEPSGAWLPSVLF
jgi:predicted N-acetyltransferase YhbS